MLRRVVSSLESSLSSSSLRISIKYLPSSTTTSQLWVTACTTFRPFLSTSLKTTRFSSSLCKVSCFAGISNRCLLNSVSIETSYNTVWRETFTFGINKVFLKLISVWIPWSYIIETFKQQLVWRILLELYICRTRFSQSFTTTGLKYWGIWI